MDLSKESLNRAWLKFNFGNAQRARIYRKLGSFLKNGVPLPDALRIMWKHATDDGKKPNDPTAQILRMWLDQIGNGRSFGRAVAGWVPNSDRIVIDAGESAGSLAMALENALFIQQSGKKIKSTIVAGLAYPVLLMILALGFLIMFATQIVPAFEEVLPRERWEGMAATMADISTGVSRFMVPILCVVAGCIAVIIWSLPKWTGPVRAKFDRLPPWSLYRLVNGAGFMLSCSALVKAGVQIPEILRILQRGATPWYEERISGTLRHVSNGVNLGEALYRTQLGFPDTETVQDLRSYAELNGFDETLEMLGRQWVVDSVERIQQQMALMKNVAMILLGVVFGGIAVGITALQQQVQTSM